jgi:phage-related protein
MTCGYENRTPVGVKIEKQKFHRKITKTDEKRTNKRLENFIQFQ